MITTMATVTDNSTDGGEIIHVTVMADDRDVIIQYLDGMQGWQIRIRRDVVLAAIETEEHG